jgi:hypothetical protein
MRGDAAAMYTAERPFRRGRELDRTYTGGTMSFVDQETAAENLTEEQKQFLERLGGVFDAYPAVAADFQVAYKLTMDIARLEDDQKMVFRPRPDCACGFMVEVKPRTLAFSSAACTCILWAWNATLQRWVCKAVRC